jgi:ankyrin repeat protein
MVEYLCKKGANVNAQNNDGATALITAAYYNLIDVAKVLIKYNSTKSLKDKYGNTALDYAMQYKYTEMISLLKNK